MAATRDTSGVLSLRGWAAEAEAAAGIAKALAPTAFVPEHLRVYLNPQERDPAKRQLNYDSTVAQIAAVLLAGQELELPPMASLRAFVVIRGQVALYAIAARALLLAHGHEIIVVESTSTRAIVRARRKGSDQWQQSTWDLDRARTAGLFPGHQDGNWRKNPKAMLVARASAEAARWVASDAMLALPPIVEEVEDDGAGMIDGVGLAQGGPEGPPAPAATTTARKPRRAARAALPAGGTAPEPPPPAPVPEEPTEPPEPINREQSKRLHAGLRDIGVEGREEGLTLIAAWVGRPVSSTGDLSKAEAGVVLDHIEKIRPFHAAGADEGGPPDAEPD